MSLKRRVTVEPNDTPEAVSGACVFLASLRSGSISRDSTRDAPGDGNQPGRPLPVTGTDIRSTERSSSLPTAGREVPDSVVGAVRTDGASILTRPSFAGPSA